MPTSNTLKLSTRLGLSIARRRILHRFAANPCISSSHSRGRFGQQICRYKAGPVYSLSLSGVRKRRDAEPSTVSLPCAEAGGGWRCCMLIDVIPFSFRSEDDHVERSVTLYTCARCACATRGAGVQRGLSRQAHTCTSTHADMQIELCREANMQQGERQILSNLAGRTAYQRLVRQLQKPKLRARSFGSRELGRALTGGTEATSSLHGRPFAMLYSVLHTSYFILFPDRVSPQAQINKLHAAVQSCLQFPLGELSFRTMMCSHVTSYSSWNTWRDSSL